MPSVLIEKNHPVYTIILNRPDVRNAINAPMAAKLLAAVEEFAADDQAHVAVLCGADGHFCAGADLQAVAAGSGAEAAFQLDPEGNGPLGPTRLLLDKPVIAAVSGYAVAGGMELALWCDLRVVETDAVFGIFCRRWGVPLIDGGTVRLPRIIGQGRALDLILTGRPVEAEEALAMGLANRLVDTGTAREAAEQLATEIAQFPQQCLRSDRTGVYRQFDRPLADALTEEGQRGLRVINSGESTAGAARFVSGKD